MAVNVKAFLEKDGDVKGEIRRFTIPSNSKDMYGLLKKKVAEVFNLPENGFGLFWQDTDGDFVVFSSTVEMVEAVHHSTDGVLRVYIRKNQDGQDKATGGSSDGEEGEEPKVHHPGVVCDGCDGTIYGPRYKCVICPDYDLCATCEQKGIHSQHDKFKITHPHTAGGHGGFMPPHFRRWMHRFMKKCPAGYGAFPAGPGGATCSGEPASSATGCGGGDSSSSGATPQPGPSTSSASGDEYLNNIGANIAAFLDPFGIDVTYEVKHGDGEKKKGHFRKTGDGQFSSGGFSMPGMFQWSGVFTNAGGCSRMPQGATPAGTSTEEEKKAEKPTEEQPPEKPSSEQTAAGDDADMEEVTVIMEEEASASAPKTQDTPKSKEGSPTGSHEDDWTMLNEGETTTDGETAAASESVPCEGLYPNLKVTQAVEMMKAMGFNDDNSWLTRLLQTTDGDIAMALDTLKLGAEQASKLK